MELQSQENQLAVNDGMSQPTKTPTILRQFQQKVRYLNRERWFRLVLAGKHTPPDGFFDNYPRFFTTSVTWAKPDRLNQRHRALIQSNAVAIAGKRVLDLASHDGRWAFAAHKAGAAYVLGIEARDHLVESAGATMREYGVPEGKVEFKRADIMNDLDSLESGSFDTVLCFGFLYHTIDHMALFRKLARLKPKHLIIDTLISLSEQDIIEIKEEKVELESNGAVGEPGTPGGIMVGRPSKSALELMLRAAGFRAARYYDWHNAGIQRWDDLEVYYLGRRISLLAESVLV